MSPALVLAPVYVTGGRLESPARNGVRASRAPVTVSSQLPTLEASETAARLAGRICEAGVFKPAIRPDELYAQVFLRDMETRGHP